MRTYITVALVTLLNVAFLALLGLGSGPACSPPPGSDVQGDDNRYEGSYSNDTEYKFCEDLPTEQQKADCHEILAIGTIYRCGVNCAGKPLEKRFECIVKVNSEELVASVLQNCYDQGFNQNQCVLEIRDLCDYPKYNLIKLSDFPIVDASSDAPATPATEPALQDVQ